MEKRLAAATGRQRQRKALQKLLRDIRAEAGIRQVELARRLGKPQSYISKYESGERRLDLVELHDICAAIGVSLADLVRRFESG